MMTPQEIGRRLLRYAEKHPAPAETALGLYDLDIDANVWALEGKAYIGYVPFDYVQGRDESGICRLVPGHVIRTLCKELL